MEKSANYNFNLPNSANDEIADINDISDNFRIIDEIMKETDQTYSPTSENAQSGKAVSEALSGYVMAEVGKGLSSNDFTDADKEKLYSALQNENIDKTYNPTSENAQSGLAVAQAVSAEQNRADNTFANALKGTMSDTAMLLDDVSPVTHEMSVKISSDTVTDLTAVKVSRCGKNLLNLQGRTDAQPTGNWPISKYDVGHVIYRGFAYTGYYQLSEEYKCDVNVDGSTITVIQKVNNYGVGYLIKCRPNTQYIFSATTDLSRFYVMFIDKDGNDLDTGSWTRNFTTTSDTEYIIICLWNTTAGTFTIVNPQLELGSTATEYEPYKECVEYTPNADGTVNGVTSLYPNTTLMTNTAGVIIDCEYNKDVNRTVSELSTPVRQTITVDTPVWATQPTITGTLNEAFETWENTPYFVTLKNTDGTALESGQFKLCTSLDGYASAIEQIFTLTGSSITLKENFLVDFKSISSDRTSFEMRDAGVSSIRINPKNLKSQRFVFALNQLSIVRNINNTKYLYLTDSFGYKNASKVKYYGPVGIYDGANGFLFGTKMSSSVSINQFGAKIELIRTKNGFITSLLGLAVYGTSKTTHMYSGFSNVFDTTEDFRNEEIKWFNLFNGADSYYFANGTEITLEEFA